MSALIMHKKRRCFITRLGEDMKLSMSGIGAIQKKSGGI